MVENTTISVGRVSLLAVSPRSAPRHYYAVGESSFATAGVQRRDTVPGTEAERERWAEAEREYRAALDLARESLERTRARRWLPLPLLEAAERRYRRRVDAASRRYQPVREEIEGRINAEHRRRERGERDNRQRRLRYHAVAEKKVWGWRTRTSSGRETVWIHRYDVVDAAPVPEDARGSKRPVNAFRLRRTLLGDSVRELAVEWDDESSRTTARECEIPGVPTSFDDWWRYVTSRPESVPEEPPATPARAPRAKPDKRRTGNTPSGHSGHGVGGETGGGFGGFGGFSGSW